LRFGLSFTATASLRACGPHTGIRFKGSPQKGNPHIKANAQCRAFTFIAVTFLRATSPEACGSGKSPCGSGGGLIIVASIHNIKNKVLILPILTLIALPICSVFVQNDQLFFSLHVPAPKLLPFLNQRISPL